MYRPVSSLAALLVITNVARAQEEAKPALTREEIERIVEERIAAKEAAKKAEEKKPEEKKPEEKKPEDELKLTPIGFVEGSYSFNFNEPSNGITNYRGFDNRHNTFTLQNVAGGGDIQFKGFEAKLVLQVGSTGSTYYLAEPALAGSSGANATSLELWKYVQEAWLSYKLPLGSGLKLAAGTFLSPIGYEAMPIKDNWNYSRSNLFFGYPYYHTGARVSCDLSKAITASVWVINGWNNVVDNNNEKTMVGEIELKTEKLSGHLLYVGGVERSTGAPEGPYWRNLFDGVLQYDAHPRLSFAVQTTGGFEPNRFGTSAFFASALYARVKIVDWMFAAARGDVFWEQVPAGATAIFWPSSWVSSQTGTIDLRPVEHVSFRLEYRHDQAEGPTYFRKQVMGDGTAMSPFVPNARSQDTILFGFVGWL